MKLTPIILLSLALLSLGFMIETPESIREQKREERAWRKAVSCNYDVKALRIFLDQQIRDHPVVEEVNLQESKTTPKWVFSGRSLNCGDWAFVSNKPEDPVFALIWVYADIPNSDGDGGVWKTITFHCRRNSKASFALDSVKKTEEEYVVLSL